MKRIPKFAYLVSSLLLLAGCASPSNEKVVLATHDSFVISDELKAQFENETGLTLEVVKAGDAGALANKLVLTKGEPIADAVYGVDNTFIGAIRGNGVVAPGSTKVIDYADVCFNYDADWFDSRGIEAPTSWEQLTLPKYAGLTAIENPTTSSTGFAFLITTIGRFGEDGWQKFWSDLKANGVKIESGWETVYYTDFSGSAGKGEYPIVLSYSSSPADEANTVALLDGCFRQREYASVLKGAKNAAGAQRLVEFMQSKSFQDSLGASMYVYPVLKGATIPEAWATKAPIARSTYGNDLDINANRKAWLKQWSSLFG